MKTNILIAGGRKLLREGLTALLEKHRGFKVIGEADDLGMVPKLMRALGAGVVILIDSAGVLAAEQVRAISASHPAPRIILLALHPNAQWVRRMLEAGAASCLAKESAANELVEAIRSVLEGNRYLSSSLVEMMVDSHAHPTSRAGRRAAQLGPREQEILQRIADGQATKEIAAELGIGTKTVETHRRRIMSKLGTFTVAELTKHAIREGLTTLEKRA